jgi:hypothetical protein
MTQKGKHKILLFLGLIIFVILLLAMSLSHLDLQPGMPLPALANGKIVVQTADNQGVVSVVLGEFILIFAAILVFGFFLYSFYKSFKGVPWVELWAGFLNFGFFILTITVAAMLILFLLPQGKFATIEEMHLPTPMPPATSPLGSVPPVLLWVVGIILLLISLLLGVWIYSTRSTKNTVMDKLIQEAEKARRALLSGHDYKDVIIKCYQQMNLALAQEQGIERQDYMTTREFETVLNNSGIPQAPIHQLTLLFENVRYGHWQSKPEDELLAIQCLEDIIRYCSKVKAAA